MEQSLWLDLCHCGLENYAALWAIQGLSFTPEIGSPLDVGHKRTVLRLNKESRKNMVLGFITDFSTVYIFFFSPINLGLNPLSLLRQYPISFNRKGFFLVLLSNKDWGLLFWLLQQVGHCTSSPWPITLPILQLGTGKVRKTVTFCYSKHFSCVGLEEK